MTLSLDAARQVLQAQPFSRLLDAELVQLSDAAVELRMPMAGQLKQQHGFVHGGVVSYAADDALTFAGGAALAPAVVTAECKINYVRPAAGDALVARARVIHAGKTQADCRCEVFSVVGDDELLCAVAHGTIAAMRRHDDP